MQCLQIQSSKIQEKSLVRQHEGYYNAYAIHKALLAHMSTSTKVSVVSSAIFTYITTAKFGNGTWNGLSESFTLH